MPGATMNAIQRLAGCASIAMVLAGMVGGVACHEGTAAKALVASAGAAPQAPAASVRSALVAAAAKPECAACAMEDIRFAAHKDQVVVSARYLGLKERWIDEHRTNRRCTRDAEVMGVVRFALVGENPWRDEFTAPPSRRDVAKMMEVDLPCPELSRPQYAKLYQYDPDDSERDGLGHAPVLRRGELYRLTFVRGADIAMREPSHPNDSRLVLTLVAVNPGGP
jgi:hypothetical protein